MWDGWALVGGMATSAWRGCCRPDSASRSTGYVLPDRPHSGCGPPGPAADRRTERTACQDSVPASGPAVTRRTVPAAEAAHGVVASALLNTKE